MECPHEQRKHRRARAARWGAASIFLGFLVLGVSFVTGYADRSPSVIAADRFAGEANAAGALILGAAGVLLVVGGVLVALGGLAGLFDPGRST